MRPMKTIMVGGVYRNIWFMWGIYSKVHIKTPNTDNDEGVEQSLLMFLAVLTQFAIYIYIYIYIAQRFLYTPFL